MSRLKYYSGADLCVFLPCLVAVQMPFPTLVLFTFLRQCLCCCLFCALFPVIVFEPRHDKTCLREFPTRSDSNWHAQLQKLARVLKFRL